MANKTNTTNKNNEILNKIANLMSDNELQKLVQKLEKSNEPKKMSDTQLYEIELKNKLITNEQLKILNKNYSVSNKNDTINKLANRFILQVKSKKISNDVIDTTFNYFIDILVKNDNDKKALKDIEKQVLKHELQNIYNNAKNVGVIVTNTNDNKVLSYGLKHKTGISCIKNMLLILLANKKIINKPPKKQKAKKSIKK